MMPRTLRSANAAMYAAITLIVVAADVYVWCTEERLARCLAATIAALTAVIWALYYILIRFNIDTDGVSEHGMFHRPRRIMWSELTEARLEEIQLQGIAGLTVILESPTTVIRISSSILSLEAVEELVEDLKKAGILH